MSYIKKTKNSHKFGELLNKIKLHKFSPTFRATPYIFCIQMNRNVVKNSGFFVKSTRKRPLTFKKVGVWNLQFQGFWIVTKDLRFFGPFSIIVLEKRKNSPRMSQLYL